MIEQITPLQRMGTTKDIAVGDIPCKVAAPLPVFEEFR